MLLAISLNLGVIIWILLFIGLVSILLTMFLFIKLRKIAVIDKSIVEISSYIKEGAMAFLKKEYSIIAPFVLIIAIILSVLGLFVQADGLGYKGAICFVLGATMSMIASYIGMMAAVKANAVTCESAKSGSISKSLFSALRGGSIIGLAVVSFSFSGLILLILVFNGIVSNLQEVMNIVTGYGLGASLIALFSRVGGGIFTKAADVGADLVGKVEVGIPEDDPRNPAVIADNVGDNVGDVAGMGADLSESYIGSLISVLTLASVCFTTNLEIYFLFPLLIAGIGLISSFLATILIKARSWKKPQSALNFATYSANGIVVVSSLLLSLLLFDDFQYAFKIFLVILTGVCIGILVGKIAEIYTSADYKSVKKIASESTTGHGTNVISGFAVGLASTGLTIVVLIIGIVVAYFLLGEVYGIALAAVSMLSTTGITVSVDGYGPISDNAGGIAEMSHQDASVRKITDKLDAVGNTTAAIGKGFSIASAAFTSVALIFAYAVSSNLISEGINLVLPGVIVGVLFGAMLPYILASMTMKSVGSSAMKMIKEVRRQFKEDSGILAGVSKPDYKKCVSISTSASLKEMILPGIISLVAPILVGILLGVQALGGMLVGALSSATMLAILMANSGGAWDNAKKYIEEGHFGGRGSEAHKAAVTGDTTGDPFKDTSGPAMNIFIKLMAIISLIIVPFLLNIEPLLNFLLK